MIKQFKSNLTALLVSVMALTSHSALAVGTGVDFGVDENSVPGSNMNMFHADSVDLSYNACSKVIPPIAANPQQLEEKGYFWLSSYQDNLTVHDSQINYYDVNGYHIYGIYEFTSDLVTSGTSVLGNRRGYQLTSARLALYLDPNQDTTITFAGCQYVIANTADDRRIGFGSNLSSGEKSEKDGLANGDFQFFLDDWTWDNMSPFVAFTPMSRVSFSANLTVFGGNNVDLSHTPNGSGNIFWRND